MYICVHIYIYIYVVYIYILYCIYIYIVYIFAALWMACGFGFTKQYCPILVSLRWSVRFGSEEFTKTRHFSNSADFNFDSCCLRGEKCSFYVFFYSSNDKTWQLAKANFEVSSGFPGARKKQKKDEKRAFRLIISVDHHRNLRVEVLNLTLKQFHRKAHLLRWFPS